MGQGSARLSERISLAIAIAIHVAAFAAVRGLVVRPAVAPRDGGREVEVEVEVMRVDVTEHARALPPGPSPAREEGSRARALAPPLASPEKGLAREGARDEAERPAPSPPTEARPLPPPLSLTQLGLEGPNRFVEVPAGASTWTIHDAEDGVRKSIAESLLKHDRSVGLGSEGPAISAIEEVVLASTAAVNGRAVLSVAADALGVITSVACIDGDHAQWDAIAADITRALGSKRLRSAPGGRGVAMRIEVTSREEMPSGRDPGLEIRAFHIPIKKGRGPKSARMDILDVDPKIVVDDTEEEGTGAQAQASPVKFPKAHIQIVKLFGLAFDPVDIGAVPRRVVHAHVLEEHLL
jgi:hypothetical protein